MFYEARIEKIRHFENLQDLLLFKNGFCYNVLYTVYHDGQLFALANDQINASSLVEVAILNLSKGLQIESITLSWFEGDFESYLKKLFSLTEYVWCKKLKFKIYDNRIVHDVKQPLAFFECGCCGKGFKSDFKYQLQFDQDAGFGICKDCED